MEYDIRSSSVKRYRPYNYRENLIREESRVRKNRRQLTFSAEHMILINEKAQEYGFVDFSNYIRFCISNKEISKSDLEKYGYTKNPEKQRKQVCFSDEEITTIESNMKNLECNNFNLYIRTIALQ